jgi:hypothetical protein
VTAATRRLGVHYPVALDNDYATWNAYGNEFWPAEYLVDQNGHVRDYHPGEGQYGRTEAAFRSLLAADGRTLPTPVELPDPTPAGQATPETYLGYERVDRYVGTPLAHDRVARYTLPHRLGQSEVAYGGRWWVGKEHTLSVSRGATIALHFVAKDVYVVLGGRGTVETAVDGKPGPPIHVNGWRLYTAVGGRVTRDAQLRLRFSPGISAYSFTFG